MQTCVVPHAVKIKTNTVWQLYLHFVMHQGSDYYHRQAEADEAVLHVLHHGRQDDQVRVERREDGPVDISALRRKDNVCYRIIRQYSFNVQN